MALSKRELRALEKLFEAEIENRLPLQSKDKIFDTLCDKGLVQKQTRSFKILGNLSISVEGYRLTLAGHYTYCSSVKEPENDET